MAKVKKVEAKIRYVHMAPQKVRRIATLVRNLPVIEAENLLENLPKRASIPIWKAIHSAAANAVHNQGLDRKNLVVAAITVGESLTLPRFMPRAQGRAYKIRKRFSHIYVTVSEPTDKDAQSEKVAKSAKAAKTEKPGAKKLTTKITAKSSVKPTEKPQGPARAKAVIKETKIK